VARVRVMAEGVGFKNNDLLDSEIKKAKENYKKALEGFKFNEALKSIWGLISFCDKYIEKEKPWEEPWEKKESSLRSLGALLVVLDNIADLLNPFLPETAEKIRKEIARNDKEFINKKRGKLLFPKI
jgi:methionyl-tRNA synthetase